MRDCRIGSGDSSVGHLNAFALVSFSWVGGAHMADIDDFDLDRSTAQAWAEFQSRLSEVISMIDDTADLTIGTESEGNGPPPFREAEQSSARRDPM